MHRLPLLLALGVAVRLTLLFGVLALAACGSGGEETTDGKDDGASAGGSAGDSTRDSTGDASPASADAPTSATADPVRFRYYHGNESIPPQYQFVTTLDGEISAGRIEATLSTRNGDVRTERRVTLSGADFDAAMETIRGTDIVGVDPADRSVGGDVTAVTLIDAAGSEREGPPTNPEDWGELVTLVQSRPASDGG